MEEKVQKICKRMICPVICPKICSNHCPDQAKTDTQRQQTAVTWASDLTKTIEDHWPNHSQRHRGLTHREAICPVICPRNWSNRRANHFDSRKLQQSGKMDSKQKSEFSEVQIQSNHFQHKSKSHERVSHPRNSNCN